MEKIPVAYDLVYNKYYVDEIYDATVVEPIKNGSDFLWHGVDEKVVDGAVNGSATTVGWLSSHLRKLETGFLQTTPWPSSSARCSSPAISSDVRGGPCNYLSSPF
jgi:NADH:ubiquinone oxidoreductase subunit 5 (subunit L)/multisubunit Na+/H+ antiporter MnhA subunit